MQNDIGNLGESIFNVAITRDYIFRPMHLGEKWPISDYYIELIGTKEVYFFIVQVKSTELGLNSQGNLKVKLPKKKLHQLNSYYCPTYFAGVDSMTEEVYLTAIHRNSRKGFSSLPTQFKLDTVNRKKLYDEVVEFWTNTNLRKYKRDFKYKIKV